VSALDEAAALLETDGYEAARARLLRSLKEDGEKPKVRAKLAVYTYKDPDLHLTRRLDEGLRVLTELDPGHPERLTDQESLGVGGAIFKRKWEVDGHERNLHRALRLYRLAAKAEKGVKGDDGYNAINAAFVLDVLADLESREDPESELPEERRTEASDWRRKIVAHLEPQLSRGERLEWWRLVTLIEALIGLGEAEAAKEWVAEAARLQAGPAEGRPSNWEIETTARQIAAIVRLRQKTPNELAFQASPEADRLRELLGDDAAAAVETAWAGKIGLALSGGGFRAALFHIGVLARLAELDVLRRVEVLSCVSGGSIAGAYYYLKLRRLLTDKADPELDREDYLKLVQEMEKDFLEAIASNVRVRLLTNPGRVLQMAVDRRYTRTERAGQLYQQRIYAGLGHAECRLPDLKVEPAGEADGFNPKSHNWRRSSKVPMLVINATTMNTGHNWQFTATWMGEPPSAIDEDVDSADRLRRMYHSEAPPGHECTPLGKAVGSSAAVPGLFPPISLRKLYPDLVVRLADGGVHDNQGIASLVDQDCSVILVSDASGQGQSIVKPGDRAFPILGRTLNVATARIRQAQYLDLATRRAASSLRGLMFVHLKKDLEREDIKWISDKPPPKPPFDAGITPYGILERVQRRLASIRTDLDSFHEYEAHGLMASGYRMVEHYFPLGTVGFPTAGDRHEWRFCHLQPAVEGTSHTTEMLAALERSDKLFFKWCRWPKAMAGLVLLLAALLLAGLVWAAAAISGWAGVVILLAALLVAGLLCAVPDDWLPVYIVSLVAKVPLGLIAMVVAPIVSWIDLWTVNRIYLHNGRAGSNPRRWDG
jgi:predicted acylesterase/phospholipase RssA